MDVPRLAKTARKTVARHRVVAGIAAVLVVASLLYAMFSSSGAFVGRLADGLTVSAFLFAVVAIFSDSAREEYQELGGPAGQKASDPEVDPESDASQAPEAPTGSPYRVVALPTDDGRELRVYEAGDTPLEVIADIVSWWREAEREGRRSIDRIEYCAKATGQGNFPWIVKFRGDELFYRVAYGGKGRKRAQGGVVSAIRSTGEAVADPSQLE